MEITLATLKMSFDKIDRSILECNTNVLNNKNLSCLLELAPKSDELSSV